MRRVLSLCCRHSDLAVAGRMILTFVLGQIPMPLSVTSFPSPMSLYSPCSQTTVRDGECLLLPTSILECPPQCMLALRFHSSRKVFGNHLRRWLACSVSSHPCTSSALLGNSPLECLACSPNIQEDESKNSAGAIRLQHLALVGQAHSLWQ